MRITVLGGCGAWPRNGQACSGYVVEHDGATLLVDPGYGSFAALIEHFDVAEVDAVFVTHSHPDHCADLSPLLRARALGNVEVPKLPVYAPHDALNRVLALDEPGVVTGSYSLRYFTPGDQLKLGPFAMSTVQLPHHVLNAGVRIMAGGSAIAYTGDTGPSADIVGLARDVDLFLCEATFPSEVRDPADAPFLMTARRAGIYAREAAVKSLLLTHLWPDVDAPVVIRTARESYRGRIDVARPGFIANF